MEYETLLVIVQPTSTTTMDPLPTGVTLTLTVMAGLPVPSSGGSGTLATFQWSPPSAQEVWVVPHNQNRYPSVTVVDNAGRKVEAEVSYLDANLVELAFAFATSGTAYLN